VTTHRRRAQKVTPSCRPVGELARIKKARLEGQW
jgi:hypothetical protein